MSDEHWQSQGWTRDEHGHWHPPDQKPEAPDEPEASEPAPQFGTSMPKIDTSIKRPVVIALVLVGVFALILWNGSKRAERPSSSARSASQLRHVIYEVEGTTTQASLTYETPNGGSSQQQDVDVPVTKKSDHTRGIEGNFGSGSFLYISAQNSKASGTVTCRITVDGIKVSENTSSGAYAIASCSGSA